MQEAQSIEQLRLLTGEIRALHKGFLTNFYLDEAKHDVWIAKGDCFFERVGETLFVVKKTDTFWNVFYNSTTQNQLSVDFMQLQSLCPAQTMMIDVVGREAQCVPIVDLFCKCGCSEVTSLVRMTRLTSPMDYEGDSSVRKATEQDIPHVSR